MSSYHDVYSNNIVFAWTNQSRGVVQTQVDNSFKPDDAESEVFLGLGFFNDYTMERNKIRVRVKTGIKSLFGPSVACKYLQAYGGYDCVLAYVPRDKEWFRIHMISFYISNQGEAVLSPHEYDTGLNAGGAPTIWYSDASEKWYLAQYTMDTNEVKIFSSLDTRNWSYKQNLGYSITSPIVNHIYTGVPASIAITR